MAVNTTEAALENKKLDLEESKQLMEATKSGLTLAMKEEKSESDRQSKESVKGMEMLIKILTEQMKLKGQEQKIMTDLVKDQANTKSKTDMKAVEMILNLLKEIPNA